MRPKKTKSLIPEVSKKLGIPENEVTSVINVYWGKIRRTLSSLDHNHVYLPGFGTFYVKPWRLDTRLRIIDNMVSNYIQNPTSRSLDIMNELYKDEIKIKGSKERYNLENIKKLEIKKLRHERRQQWNEDMARATEDIRGDQEQNL